MNLKLSLNMPTINFFIRSNNDKSKSSVLYCRVRVNNSVCEFSLKEKIDKRYWNQKSNMYKSANKDVNKYIENLIDNVRYRLKTKAIFSNENLSAKQLVEAFNNQQQSVKLVDICQKYIEYAEKNKVVSAGTLKNYNVKLKNLIEFCQHTNTKFTAEQFTLKVAQSFIEHFCKSKNTNNITSANRNVLFYKQSCIYYRKHIKAIKSEIFDFECEKDKTKAPVFLNENELHQVKSIIFTSTYLSRIRDLFIFQCYTGISYCDLWGKWEIKKEEFGTIITGTRAKNGQTFWIPIESNIPLNILEKYGNELPKYENQVYNRILKEIGMICGIEKRITTHVARKTFATLMDAQGWTRETVSKMLGHKSVKTTELYYLGESFARLENEYRNRKAI